MASNRRVFMMAVATASAAMAMQQSAHAQVKLDEQDPQAVALGYVADAAKADKKKYTRYAAGQTCATCSLYQGKATDPAAACTLFAGKQVPGKAWCSAWVRKA